MWTIAVANQKGGVGKTTTAQHLAVALARAAQRVLAIDLDQQCNLTMAAGVDVDALGRSVFSVVVEQGCDLVDVMLQVDQGYALAPAEPDLVRADLEIISGGSIHWHRRLARALHAVTDAYDFCVIDCPPNLGALTVNGLVAADAVAIPVSPEMWPVKGMQRLRQTIDEVTNATGRPRVAAIVPTLVRRDRTHAKILRRLEQDAAPAVEHPTAQLERAQHIFGDAPLAVAVPVSAHFTHASFISASVFEIAPKSRGAIAYQCLAELVMAGAASTGSADARATIPPGPVV
jgi:chromosome partitioning protein